MNKFKLIIIAGVIFLILNYFVIDYFYQIRQQEMIDSYLKGYDQGLENSISFLYNKTESCNLASITLENSSRILIDRSCVMIKP